MTDRAAAIVDAVRLRVEDELRQQLGALVGDHQRELSRVQDVVRRAAAETQQAEERWTALLADLRSDTQRTVEAAVAAARAEADAEREAEREASGKRIEGFRRLMQEFDGCGSISGLLDHLAAELRSGDGRLFVMRRGALQPWPQGAAIDPEWQALAQRALETISPQHDGQRMAAPIVLDGTSVAVVVGDQHQSALPPDLLAAAAEAKLAARVAARLVHADRWLAAPASEQHDDAEAEAGLSARRYAQLLISEIKLYNEAAVAEGRRHRDLLRRLEPEITRARQIFDARVPQGLRGRADYFQDELVRILADGDPSLLS